MTGNEIRDPHDPDAEPHAEDPIEHDRPATAELQDLLDARNHGNQQKISDPEDAIERASEDDSLQIDWAVVAPLAAVVIAVVVWGLTAKESFSAFSDASFTWVISNLGWAYVFFGTVFVFFIIVIAVSRFGKIRLGASDEQPEFSTMSWIAMMFAAGMGIGLMFFGASEPLNFYRDGIPGMDSADAVGTAMAQTMFHWTLHPWSVYAIIGLAIAYSTFRLGRKQLLSSAFITSDRGEEGRRMAGQAYRRPRDLRHHFRHRLLPRTWCSPDFYGP